MTSGEFEMLVRRLLTDDERGSALAEAQLIAHIRRLGANDWRAAAWILSRRAPSRYGRESIASLMDRDEGVRTFWARAEGAPAWRELPAHSLEEAKRLTAVASHITGCVVELRATRPEGA